MIFLGIAVLAKPAANFYGEPLLSLLLPAAAISAIISGFNPTKAITENRKMALGRLTLIQVVSQIVGLSVMIPLAFYTGSVWALVAGGLLSPLAKLVGQNMFLPGPSNHFCWEINAIKELYRFGRWIFIGTLATFVGGEGLRLIQGALVTPDILGMISIAGTLAWAMGSLVTMLSSRIVFPLLSEVARENPPKLKKVFLRIKIRTLCCTQPIFYALILFSTEIINGLYDERYSASGVFLAILSFVACFSSSRTFYGAFLLATNNAKHHMYIQIVGAVVLPSCLWLGFLWSGDVGMIMGMALAGVIIFPFEVYYARQLGFFTFFLDAIVFLVGFYILTLSLPVGLIFN
jgi:O-antigen/teichoic acid export membrane protein